MNCRRLEDALQGVDDTSQVGDLLALIDPLDHQDGYEGLLDGLTAELGDHIRQCPDCSEHLRGYERIAGWLAEGNTAYCASPNWKRRTLARVLGTSLVTPSSSASWGAEAATELLDPRAGVQARSATNHSAASGLEAGSRRRRRWWSAVLGAVTIAVSGGALFLVWQQVENQKQSLQPTQLVIESARAGSAPNEYIVGPDPVPAAPSGTGADRAAAPPVAGESAAAEPAAPTALPAHDPTWLADPTSPPRGADVRRRPRKIEPAQDDVEVDPMLEKAVQEHVESHRTKVIECVAAHGNVPRGSALELLVGRDGRLQAITLAPAKIDGSPLGVCIKKVFRAGVFPHGDIPYRFKIPLTRSV
jgi:hypothetical protein